jgi:hypothetical protein
MEHTTIHRGQSFTSHPLAKSEGALVDLDAYVATSWANTGSSVLDDIERYHYYEAVATELVEGESTWTWAAHLLNTLDFSTMSNPYLVNDESSWVMVGDDTVFRLLATPKGRLVIFRCQKVNVGAKRGSVLSGRTLRARPGGYTLLQPEAYMVVGDIRESSTESVNDEGEWVQDWDDDQIEDATDHTRRWASEVRDDRLDAMLGFGDIDDSRMSTFERRQWAAREQAAERVSQRREAIMASASEVPVDPFLLLDR